MKVDVIIGLQWGDEGKGKIVDFLADQYAVIARFQEGPNAGHTLKFDGKKFVLHTIPSGIFREDKLNLIGNGVVIDPIALEKELLNLQLINLDYHPRLLVARKAHLILPTHRYLDAASEAAKGKEKIGSTLRGIGPAYMDKTGRNGLRVGDIHTAHFEQQYQTLKEKHLSMLKMFPPILFNLQEEEDNFFSSLKALRQLQTVDGEYFINNALQSGKHVLAEGAQGAMLDIDFGTYPFVTSSNTVTAGVCSGLGVAPQKINRVIGISKAYCTRVGGGPFPTELNDEVGERIRQEGNEFGSTTGRPRRCGWIDIPQLKYTIMINGVTEIALTKVDVLNMFEEIGVATHYQYHNQISDALPYSLTTTQIQPLFQSHKGWQQSLQGITAFEQFPEALTTFVASLESALGVPISMVSTGAERDSLVVR